MPEKNPFMPQEESFHAAREVLSKRESTPLENLSLSYRQPNAEGVLSLNVLVALLHLHFVDEFAHQCRAVLLAADEQDVVFLGHDEAV